MFGLIEANILKYIDAGKDELQFFTSKLERASLKKKEKLITAGEHCRHVAFVNKGCLRSFIYDKDGNEHILQFAIEDHWISDLYSFLSGQPAIYTIEAIENTELLKISVDSLEEVYTHFPKYERFFRLLIQKSYVVTQQRMVSALSENAEEKYLALIERSPMLINRLPQQYLASYLGITPESFSRIKKKLFKK
jgi:CRP-like cAMP-binding protein